MIFVHLQLEAPAALRAVVWVALLLTVCPRWQAIQLRRPQLPSTTIPIIRPLLPQQRRRRQLITTSRGVVTKPSDFL